MKKLSDTYKELGIAFSFPINIKDTEGNDTYYEDSNGYWCKWEYNTNGDKTLIEDSAGYWCKWEYDTNANCTYYEDSNDYWCKIKYDSEGNEIYCENSILGKKGTPRSQSCDGKVIQVDGKKYQLKEL